MRAKTWAELYDIENVDEKGKKKKHKIQMHHNPDAEWLTTEICREYHKKALALGTTNDVGARRDLRIELQKRCDLIEVEALNILDGKHFSEYVRKYDIMQGKDVAGYEMTSRDRAILDAVADAEDRIKERGLEDENI